MQVRLPNESFNTDQLLQMVFEVSKNEDADRSKLGAKDARLLGLFLGEKVKLERQNEPKNG